MAIRKTRSGSTTVKAAAGFAPLALALLLSRSVLPGTAADEPPAEGSAEPAVCADDIEGVRGCHTDYPTGCSKAGKYDGYLNLLKNQLPQPTARPIRTLAKADFADLDRKTPKDLARSNHGDFKDQLAQLGEGQIHSVVGYLYYAQKGGTSESSNCQLSQMDEIDFHIGIGFDETLAQKALNAGTHKLSSDDHDEIDRNSVIVEMTPHYRLRYKQDWSLDLLHTAVGHQVKVTGQLLIDNEHNNSKDNCALGGKPGCWRLTTWELHPVTQFQVCSKDSCAENSPDWVDLENWQPAAKTVTNP